MQKMLVKPAVKELLIGYGNPLQPITGLSGE